MIIDAHQHFWRPQRGDYGWLTPALPSLYRDFMPDDLEPFLRAHEVAGTILVQAAPTVAETEFLLRIAEATPFVLGVVGWVDLISPDACTQIERLSAHPKLLGLRPMIQDIEDDDWMLRADLAPAIQAMIAYDLTFDALVLPRHLSRLRAFLRRYPELRVVIDHGAKPEIASGAFDVWASDMAAIAGESGAYCKVSGLLNEAGENWSIDLIRPYIAHLVTQFGPKRLIWGSDWPVLTCVASYEDWCAIVSAAIGEGSERDDILGRNACEFYGLSNCAESRLSEQHRRF